MNEIDNLGQDARTVPELVEDAKEVLEWAKALGVRIGNDNWIQHIINKMERILVEPSEEEKRKRFLRLYSNPIESQNNIADMVHLGFMRRHIGEQDNKILCAKLFLALRGADSVRQETPANTKSRDARYELSMCARLNERGYSSNLAEPNPDIWVKRKNIKAAIECKRVYSSQGIERRLIEGWKQLRNRPAINGADLHVIFCDITRAFTDGQKHLQGLADDVLKELQGKLYQQSTDIIKLLERNCASEVDAVVLTYQDYIEPVQSDYVLRGITQQLVIINSGRWRNGGVMVPRQRRRLALKFFKNLDHKGKILYEDSYR